MSENSKQSHDECVETIDTLYVMAHSGCFNNISNSILNKATSLLRLFMDVDVTIKQASEIFGKPIYTIKNNIYRKLTKAEYPEHKSVIKFSKLYKIMGEKLPDKK